MSRSNSSSDGFEAIAEPRRREIIQYLASLEPVGSPVNDIALAMRLPQPATSKHLAILREAGLVSVEAKGQSRIYRVNLKQLDPVEEWIHSLDRFFASQLDRIKQRAESHAKPPRRPRP